LLDGLRVLGRAVALEELDDALHLGRGQRCRARRVVGRVLRSDDPAVRRDVALPRLDQERRQTRIGAGVGRRRRIEVDERQREPLEEHHRVERRRRRHRSDADEARLGGEAAGRRDVGVADVLQTLWLDVLDRHGVTGKRTRRELAERHLPPSAKGRP